MKTVTICTDEEYRKRWEDLEGLVKAMRKAFPPQGGRWPSAHTGADEGASEQRKTEGENMQAAPWGRPYKKAQPRQRLRLIFELEQLI